MADFDTLAGEHQEALDVRLAITRRDPRVIEARRQHDEAWVAFRAARDGTIEDWRRAERVWIDAGLAASAAFAAVFDEIARHAAKAEALKDFAVNVLELPDEDKTPEARRVREAERAKGTDTRRQAQRA